MDGFCGPGRGRRHGARLPVVARIAAGSPAERPLAAAESMAISTGGAVPEGRRGHPARAGGGPGRVDRDPGGGHRRRQCPEPGKRRADRRVVLDPPPWPAQSARLAAAAASTRCRRKRPRVGILVTGSELKQPGTSSALGRSTSRTGFCRDRAAAGGRCTGSAWGSRGRPGRARAAPWSVPCSASTCS
jgi:molybdopterin molybdotransferase